MPKKGHIPKQYVLFFTISYYYSAHLWKKFQNNKDTTHE